MSVDATRWAWQVRGISATDKIVLLSLADRAGEDHQCWPSYERLVLDTCLNRKTVSAALGRLEARGVIEKSRRFSSSSVYRLVGVPSRTEIGTTSSTKIGTASSTEIGTISSAEIGTLTYQEPINEPTNRKRARFAAPTLAEVVEFCVSHELDMDAAAFVDYYESKGWTVGKAPMKDWHAAARGWARREKKNPPARTGTTKSRTIIEDLTDRSWATP